MKRITLFAICAMIMLNYACTKDDIPPVTNFKNNRLYVDLGLPSGVKWATCNVGASIPENYGNKYAWGEIKVKLKYTAENSLTYGMQIHDISANEEYDVACANWQFPWRIPTKTEMEELIKNCEWKRISQKDIEGFKIIGPNDNYIFLPIQEKLDYWTSTPNTSNYNNYSYSLYDFGNGNPRLYSDYRYVAKLIRPVFGGDINKPMIESKISNITATSVECTLNIVSEGGLSILDYGFCWSNYDNPTIDDNYTIINYETNNFTTIINNLIDDTTYYLRAYSIDAEDITYSQIIEFKTNKLIDGHDWVDLGLDSGIKWATCNIGADYPEEYGNYYAWGETEIKNEYTSENSLTYGIEMNDISGNPQYDAARNKWGGAWRIPTSTEMYELQNKCSKKWIEQDGIKGFRITGPNGNYIFFPAAGRNIDSTIINSDLSGCYWISKPLNNYVSYCLESDKNDTGLMGVRSRECGLTIRPVIE
ncbi:MAG: hypothetical protein IKY27_04685 [Bacteroidales bacterium]|nr:hypothetical protein [Bacteroidales bacterium]